MKPSQLNTNDNPPAESASSPRVHPCFGHDPNAAAVAVLTDDGISYLLPFAQFMCARRMANPALEQDPDAPTDKMSIHFVSAEVIVLGGGLERLESRLQKYDLSYIYAGGEPLGRRA